MNLIGLTRQEIIKMVGAQYIAEEDSQGITLHLPFFFFVRKLYIGFDARGIANTVQYL